MIQRRVLSEHEAKAALAERRRLAREEAERQAELERQKQEEERQRELQLQAEEEERQRQFELEAQRLVEEQRQAEEKRLQQAIEEAQQREEAERLRKGKLSYLGFCFWTIFYAPICFQPNFGTVINLFLLYSRGGKTTFRTRRTGEEGT